MICFYCQQSGHKASVCPMRKAKLTGACYAPRPEIELVGSRQTQGTEKPVVVNGQQTVALLDSGSFTSLVKRSLVPVSTIDYSTKTDIVCVHGDCHVYPKSEISVEINGQQYLLTVAVVDDLPKDLILGTDFPLLMDLLQGGESDFVEKGRGKVASPVVTRSQVQATGLQPLPDLDDSLFEGGTKGPHKSKRQRRFEKELGGVGHDVNGLTVDGLWEVPGNIASLQRQDVSLKSLYEKVVKGPHCSSLGQEQFVLDNDVLYACNDDRKRLVIPATCRQLIMHLAHTFPWAGHLGRHKTFLRISARFFWPGMYTDVQTYCSTCPECQLTSCPRKSDRALLQPLPIISEPFRRIAMDIVGPLPRSSRGHQYILVLSDYATRFPEAFPLRTITAPSVLRALIQLFSRVGIPEEIVTDQGTNFTSRLLHLFHKQLGITAIKTTPYHPQTDGLVERFNQTLKRMLRKFVDDSGKDWDRWLPFLLFAYREVPQASTGFSPFELLYGWDVQGPLDLLTAVWTSPDPKANERGVVQFVLQMRDRLAQYREEAKVNLKEAQQKQKLWYDKQARTRNFEPGQKVLLLLPSSNSKLLAKWQGPYVVIRRMGPVTYEIHHPERKRAKQTYHVNLLKEWKERAVSGPALLPQGVEEVDKEDGPDVRLIAEVEGDLDLSHLVEELVVELRQLFAEMPSLFSATPGKTRVIEHTIRLKDTRPFRQRPYRVPQKLVGQLQKEIEAMLQLGVIEPSNSEWCSPVVIVYKKDGTLRICIDFRKLNSVSEFDAYPMPRIDELLERIGSARYITTLDLCKGYWQVPLDPSSRPYTAFRTPAGLFQFTVMPFGLHGAPATFQRLMDKVLQGCEECSAAYLDDVVIYSQTWEAHLGHLKKVLGKIQSAGLTLNLKKCEWVREEVRYLGYQLGQGKVRPQADKVEAIRNCPRPRTKKEVRSFLGLAGWYRRFVPRFATIASPLTALTGKDRKNPVTWTNQCETAFQSLKESLCSSPVLQSPDFTKRFLVQVDASAVGIGAVLAQGEPGEERPILYLSRKLLPREVRYSVVEKEGLAIKWALESLRYYLLGREFDLETDHRALTWIHSMKDHNSRLTRWYLSLQPFRFAVRYRKGATNVVADYLSRLPYNLGEGEDGVTEQPRQHTQ
uniref:Gypsy retrotransposon integrase-like protein 1 n=2 Tax=Acanthochromis polyacanthus TaxID=80966 RepID=A0A3Q1EX45_9TELE